MAAVIDEGLCLRTWDWSETSQTALIFFRSSGMLRVLAKGSKRERGPFSGGLETLTRAEARVYPKPAATLVTLGSWELEERFDGARQTLAGFYGSMYVVDVVTHALTEADPHPGLYDTICASLRGMRSAHGMGPEFQMAGTGEGTGGAGAVVGGEAGGEVVRGVVASQWAALVESGHRPELHVSVEDGRELASSDVYAFVPSEGAFMDGRSRAREIGQEIWRVRRSTVELLRSLQEAMPETEIPPAGIPEPRRGGQEGGISAAGMAGQRQLGGVHGSSVVPAADPITIWRGARFLHAYLRWVLGVDLATFNALSATVESGGLGSGK